MTGGGLFAPHCVILECGSSASRSAADDRLSVIVIFDDPFDGTALDEALFSLAIQDHTALDVIVVLPDSGPELPHRVRSTLQAQPWPDEVRLRVAAVRAPSTRTVSAHLLNAGLSHAAGRYVALIHHQDLVYQHAYRLLIERLRGGAPVAFGGMRVVTHGYGRRHWMVVRKERLKPDIAAGTAFANGRGALHVFIADRRSLDPDYLIVRQPRARLSTTIFLNRLAAHPRADFSLAGTGLVESRSPPHVSTAADLGRLPSIEETRATSAWPTFRR